MPLSDWTQALSGQGIKLHKSLSNPHTWWHFEPVQTIIWSLRFTSSTPSIPTASCQPACLRSERAGEIKCQRSISKKQRSLVKKNQTSGIGADLKLRRCETMRQASTSKHWLEAIQHQSNVGSKWWDQVPAESGVDFDITSGCSRPYPAKLWKSPKMGISQPL